MTRLVARHPDLVSRRHGAHHAAARAARAAVVRWTSWRRRRRRRCSRESSGGARGDRVRQARRATRGLRGFVDGCASRAARDGARTTRRISRRARCAAARSRSPPAFRERVGFDDVGGALALHDDACRTATIAITPRACCCCSRPERPRADAMPSDDAAALYPGDGGARRGRRAAAAHGVGRANR